MSNKLLTPKQEPMGAAAIHDMMRAAQKHIKDRQQELNFTAPVTSAQQHVKSANDMWHELYYVKRVVDGKYFTLKTYPNGSPAKPKNGSFIIYEKSSKLPFGHVAVIVDVASSYVRVAEQNYYYDYWHNNYAREIRLKYTNDRYYIDDRFGIYGWMEVQDDNQLKPLDEAMINIISDRNGASG
ncbi:unnamed protein product [Adineta steineri]|uniref:Peptidase C51 domain-containing protein n=2 Tax=Adineta steineri TaxID=433720 RepID=A0A814H9D4_9BILA|nr:unnamed protein product [Adineta steineri]